MFLVSRRVPAPSMLRMQFCEYLLPFGNSWPPFGGRCGRPIKARTRLDRLSPRHRVPCPGSSDLAAIQVVGNRQATPSQRLYGGLPALARVSGQWTFVAARFACDRKAASDWDIAIETGSPPRQRCQQTSRREQRKQAGEGDTSEEHEPIRCIQAEQSAGFPNMRHDPVLTHTEEGAFNRTVLIGDRRRWRLPGTASRVADQGVASRFRC